MTGFHKRKKKRRKEAQKHIEEKERLKRIAVRKKVSFHLVSVLLYQSNQTCAVLELTCRISTQIPISQGRGFQINSLPPPTVPHPSTHPQTTISIVAITYMSAIC